MSNFPASSNPPKDLTAPIPPPNSLPTKTSFHDTSFSNARQGFPSHDLHQNDLKTSLMMREKVIEDEWSVKSSKKKDGFDSLESVVRIKEAEARMFQNRADDARREAEGFRRMVRVKSEKFEEEYSEKLAKLCLKETEENRRKKLEELKILENSHLDYYKMKMRMQTEIACLLERMEATKQKLV